MNCKNCNATTFRTSKLRTTDFTLMLLLQYPVRCRHCHARTFVNILRAYGIHRARKLRRRQESRPVEP